MRWSLTLLLPLMLSAGLVSSAKGPCRPNMVRVRVLDVRGNPVAYASVIALQTPSGDLTNEWGWATLAGLPDGAITIKVRSVRAFDLDTALVNDALMRVVPDSCGTTPLVVRLGPDHKVFETWFQSGKGGCEALVCASDSVSGRPIVGALVSARLSRRGDGRTDLYFHTDSSGCARLGGLPIGGYPLDVCSNVYGLCTLERFARPGLVDTVRVVMRYLGPPADGRRCEVMVEVPR